MKKKELQLIIEAAQAGGAQAMRFFGKQYTERHKGHGDVVTQADLAADKKIVQLLRRAFPDYNIVSEESKKIDNRSDYTFVIDPIDGTANFKINSAAFTCSVALFKKTTLQAGVVYAPATKETFSAVRGMGAFKNKKKINVAKAVAKNKTIVGYGEGWKVANKITGVSLKKIIDQNFFRALNSWSPALDLCRIAEGKIHAAIFNQANLYDIAAGKLIATEAGAKIFFVDRSKLKNDCETTFVTANTIALGKKLQSLFKHL